MADSLILTIILALTIALPYTASAVDNSQPMNVRGFQTAPSTAPKRLALATVTTIQDSLLTIKVNNVTHKILIDDKTKITRNGKPLQQADIKMGMKVRISFVARAGSKVATAIDVRVDAEHEAIAPMPVPPPPGSKTLHTIQ